MIQSMTGYGKAEYTVAEHKTTVEIRSLNSKQLDLSLKTAPLYHDKELDIRGMVREALERGKVDVLVTSHSLETADSEDFAPINWEALRYYRNEYQQHAQSLGLPVEIPSEVLASLFRMPDVLREPTASEELSEEEWLMLQNAVKQAIDELVGFRKQEGEALQKMFTEKLDTIEALLAEVELYEKGRVEHIRQHLLDNLDKLADKTKQAIDKNRL
ncbi:MAG: hypothetical protein J5635_01990, partial [Paludibacteraceae bacterium]|nr:hypothetical protein [Paludibacteraceae bacterium]